MSYFTSKMSGEAVARKYEREREYRQCRKSLCMVVTKPAYTYLARIAESLGWSVTRTIMFGAVCFWKSKSTYEIGEIRKAPKADIDFIARS